MAYNSDHFDLTDWNITIPRDSSGSITGTAVIIQPLTNYESQWFYDAPDGAMVFKADVSGATTSGSNYARSELRELESDGDRAFWNLSTGATMTATLKVDAVPTLFGGTAGKEVIGQIHGQNDELVRLYWDNGTVYFKNDQAGSSNSELKFLLQNTAGETPDISIGETFSYMIDAHNSTLAVKVYADGDVYNSVTSINSVWQSDTFYFKAGVYLGVNETQGTGYGQTSFYGLDFGHTAGSGMGGLLSGTPAPSPTPAPTPAPSPTPTPSPSPTPTGTLMNGTSGNDTINADHDLNTAIYGGAGDDSIIGHDGNDLLYGQEGNDKIIGYWGNDLIDGGAGNDSLNGDVGDDTVIGGTGADTVTGGSGHDTFIVNRGDNGTYISDFTTDATNGDRAIMKGFSATELSSAQLTQSGSDALLTFTDGTAVTFHNVQTGALTTSNLLADTAGTLTGLFGGAGPTPSPTPTPTPTDTITGTSGRDTLNADQETGTTLYGAAGDDSLIGHDGDDALYGQDGSDKLWGNWGSDILDGGKGNDSLQGGEGTDSLYGRAGSDKLYGGAGADTFVFMAGDYKQGKDTVADFSLSQGDRIDLSDVLHGHYDPLTDALTDFVKITSGSSSSTVSVDLDGAGRVYGWVQMATLSGATGLTDEALLANDGNLIVS
ncbi:MAG: polysaccharide lyase family 7 protein [Alphaproteobacteria bacterium]